MPALLLIELMGSRDRWRQGPELALQVTDVFQRTVAEIAHSLHCRDEITGQLEGDRIAVFLPSVEAAIALGRRTFRRAFYLAQTPEDPRLWLRGVVVDATDVQAFRSKPLLALPGIERRVAGTAMRHALTTLHSGVRGMRLLVADALITDNLRGAFRVPVAQLGVIPFRRLNHTPYPTQALREFQDCLWMADGPREWNSYLSRMSQRLLWAARNHEEMQQAAATQAVFLECQFILRSVQRKALGHDGGDYREDPGLPPERDERWSDPAEPAQGEPETDQREPAEQEDR